MRVLAMLFARAAIAQNLPLPPLPYDYNALEPHIDEATMRVHHLSHHQTYTDKLNGALGKLRADPEHKYLAKMGIDALLQNLDKVPTDLQKTVRNAGGGYVNHDFFFKCMSPDGGGEPSGPLLDGFRQTYGSFAKFQQHFTLAALEVFGSGWIWLVWHTKDSTLQIMSTPNQDTPAMSLGVTPLLGLDLWEHAYYLKHQSRRKNYVDDFFKVINWPEVMTRFENEVTGKATKAEL